MMEENWSIGKTGGCVITDNAEGLPVESGFSGNEAEKYYGGALICESVWRKKDAHLISAAAAMQRVLKYLLEHDDGVGICLGYQSKEMIEEVLKKAEPQ